MGIKDRIAQATGPAQAMAGVDGHYEAVVNKNDLNMARLTAMLNQRWNSGWRLDHVLEQNGNTVMIFERRT